MLSATAPSRDDQLVTLLAAAPPRAVPPEWRRAARRQAAPVWLLVIGLVFAVAGAVGMVEYFPWHYFSERRLAADDTARAPGRVVAVERTRLAVSHLPVMRLVFEFRPGADGEIVRGVCYLLAQSSQGATRNPATRRPWRAGDAATVRYRPEELALARLDIAGANLDPAGTQGALMLLSPAIGLGVLIGVSVSRRRAVRLLTHGVLAEARVTAVERYVRGKTRGWEITLQHTDDPTLPPWTKLERGSNSPGLSLALQRLESKQPVFVLYDPVKPKRVLLPEALSR